MTSPSSPSSTAIVAVAPEMSREQLDLLKRTIAKGTTDDEFRLFLEACKRRRFDPFSKLLYPVKRWDRDNGETMALQASIDSFRLVAERSKVYAGQVGPHWCGKDGVWKDVWLDDAHPAAARVGVLRSDFKEPLYAVALWTNYAQKKKDGTLTKFWLQMGPLMLAKCAESQALRRAFPEDLAGLYTSDEMPEVQPSEPREPEILPRRDPNPTTIERIDMKTGEVLQGIVEPNPTPKRISPSSGREVVWQKGDPAWTTLWEWKRGETLETPMEVTCPLWAQWADEPLPSGKLKSMCNPPTWRTAAKGSLKGGRHALLLNIVQHFHKSERPATEAPLEYQRAACTLAMLIAGHERQDDPKDIPNEPLFDDPATENN